MNFTAVSFLYMYLIPLCMLSVGCRVQGQITNCSDGVAVSPFAKSCD